MDQFSGQYFLENVEKFPFFPNLIHRYKKDLP